VIVAGQDTTVNDSLSAMKQSLVVAMSHVLPCAAVFSWRGVTNLEEAQHSKQSQSMSYHMG